jgi:very-short-patch-repair endonuclease
MPTLDDLLLPVFLAQHGLVSRRDVLRAGGTPHHIDTRLRSGRWERAEAGVYRLAGVPVDWRSELLAPILSVDGRAVASHTSAAVLHGIPGFGRGVPELTIPRGTKLRRRSVRVHTSTDLERTRATAIDGIPVTELRRTLLDLARIVGDQRLLRAIEWSRRERSVTWAGLITTLALHARRGRPGIARLRRVILANADRDEVTDSDLELIALAVIREHGLPEPVLHHRVLDGDRFVAEVDLAYPHLRIAIELDGAVHLDRQVRERDLPRQNDLVLLGWTILRFTWDRLQTRPDLVIAEITAAIRAAELRVAG